MNDSNDRARAASGSKPQAKSAAGMAATNGRMSRAERFEDEKKRIIESCFGKKDADGVSFAESYITHIRIIEDASSPSTPPPPDSAQDNKKPRIIIVAVRKSGRVRMHKARENANGTFSIGKTWVLDDLTALESFSGSTPTTPEAVQAKKWAEGTGFIVTIVKPYFWQAATTKEKEFFVASLVKIYRKYTGGKMPQLVGFDQREMDHIMGGSQSSYNTSGQHSIQTLPPLPAPTSPAKIAERPDSRRRPSGETARKTPDPTSAPRPPGQFPADYSRRRELDENSNRPSSSRDVSRTDSLFPSRPGISQSKSSTDGMTNGNALSPQPAGLPSSRVRPQTPESNYASPVLTQQSSPRSIMERSRPPLANRADSISNEGFALPRTTYNNASGDRGSSRGSARSGLNDAPGEELLTGKRFESARTSTPETSKSAASSIFVTSKEDHKPADTIQTTASQTPVDSREEEQHRPGLGPMIKKKSNRDIAKTFRKAATAYNAFKPRFGGTTEKFEEGKDSAAADDGGNAVGIPSKSALRASLQKTARTSSSTDTVHRPEEKSIEEIPEVKVTRAANDTNQKEAESDPQSLKAGGTPEKSRSRSPKVHERKQRRRSGQAGKYFIALDVNPNLLEPRHIEFEAILTDFGWEGQHTRTKKIEQLEAEIKRDIGRVEAGSWLGHLEQTDDRVEAVDKMLDRAIAECDDFEALLTLYSVELSTLNEDIAFIEAQSQGLQVQTANQKLLHTELESLLQTISVSSSDLAVLKETSLDSTRNQEAIEAALSLLYKAMITIDPALRPEPESRPGVDGSSNTANGGYGNSELGTMRALKEKKEGYRAESIAFLRRLKQFMNSKFQSAMTEASRTLERERNTDRKRSIGSIKSVSPAHDMARQELWRYGPLMLFARDVDFIEWEEMLRSYERSAKHVYSEDFRYQANTCKNSARKPTGEEQDLLFTAQEKESEGLAHTAARKLTVKRSQTLAKSLRSTDTEGKKGGDRFQSGSLYPCEVIDAALDGMVPVMFTEQNFIVDFFHISSLMQESFSDTVSRVPPKLRKGSELRARKMFDPDRHLAKKVADMMDEIYSSWPAILQNLVDWSIHDDPLQGVGVLQALERKMADLDETNQEYILRNLSKIHERLAGLFSRFLDEQVHAIEETKVKIKKRKGVIAFMKTFPHFSVAIENMLPPPEINEDLDVREMVNAAYDRINKAMFESLQAIAKDSPSVLAAGQGPQGQGLGDPEDKEALNYHILLIENMNHYMEEVESRGNLVLEEWKDRAARGMQEHLDLYLSAVIRRPLGKLLDFLESTESLLSTGLAQADIPTRASHSRSTFKKILSAHDAKEIRRGIDTLKKRVEKHFGDADDPNISRELVIKVLGECELMYGAINDRVRRVVEDVYENGLEVGWGREDVAVAFRR